MGAVALGGVGGSRFKVELNVAIQEREVEERESDTPNYDILA